MPISSSCTVGLYAPASASAPANVPFGVEARWKFLYAFQVGVSGLYLSGASPSLAVFTDIGATVDLPPFTIGGAIGPDFSIGLGGAGTPATTKVNFKVSGEFNFGSFSVGLVAFDPVSTLSELRQNWPWVGITFFVTLF